MSYKKSLDEISLEISLLASEDSIKNLRVYKNNIFNLSVNQLREAYPGVYKYVGKRNFSFFARKILLDEKIKSPNINTYLKSFPNFLEKIKETHQDEILIKLSKIDHLWSYGVAKEVVVDRGLFRFWSGLINNEKPEAVINWEAKEVVFAYEAKGERYLSVRKC